MGLVGKVRSSFDLTKTEDKLKLALIVLGLLIFILVLSATAIQLTLSPDFCSKCHEMTPEYRTWQASSHSQIRCVECHIPPGLGNLIVHKVAALKELYLHFTDSYEKPIAMGHEIEDSICQQCHSKQRHFTVSGDLIIPHSKHEDNKVHCVKCHSGVAHGNIARRGKTSSGDLASWTLNKGKDEMTAKKVRPQMVICMECHQKLVVSNRCTTCHKALPIPQDHKVNTWINGASHGLLAEKNIGYCHSCHSYGVKIKEGINLVDPTKYIRGNSFCSHCHQTRPQNHTADWLKIHKPQAIAKGTRNCFACHNSAQPTAGENTTATYCNKCHWFKP